MTGPASTIKRQIDDLIELQIITLKRSSSLSPSELTDYHARYARISRLFIELDRSRPLPPNPILKRRHRVHASF